MCVLVRALGFGIVNLVLRLQIHILYTQPHTHTHTAKQSCLFLFAAWSAQVRSELLHYYYANVDVSPLYGAT